MGTKGHGNPVFLLVFFASLALIAGGCGSSSSSAGSGEAADSIFSATADPVKVSVKTDESRRSSAVIPKAGGTVSATAMDGTRFTLSLPKDALLSEETISLIPVSAVDGLPLSGGMSAAVQLEPAGLLLFAPATLTMESPHRYLQKSLSRSATAARTTSFIWIRTNWTAPKSARK